MASKQDQINKEMAKHAKVANEEMGAIKLSLQSLQQDHATVKADVVWLKEFFMPQGLIDKMDTRLWWILGTVILLSLISIAFKLHG